MRRIDDKIKEIEKKDKRNNILYIAFIIVVAGFMGYALLAEKKMKAQGETINELGQTLEEANDSLSNLNAEYAKTIETLRQSITPTGYWEDTVADNSTQAYIDYLTQKKITILHPAEALAALQGGADGTEAWLFCGRKSGSNFNERVSKVILRSGTTEADNIANTPPEEGDIVENNSNNRETYRRFGSGNVVQSSKNPGNLAFIPGDRAVVLEVEEAGNAVFMKIKF